MCWLYAITKYRYIPTIQEILAAIDDAKRLGFKFMELEGVGPQLHVVDENKKLIKRKCEENEVKIMDFVPVIPDLMSSNHEKRRIAINKFRIGCEIASYFETGMVQADTFHLPVHREVPYDIKKGFRYIYNPPKILIDFDFNFWSFFEDVVVQSISECNDITKEFGLKLCIEPRTWENIPNPWALELLLREIRNSNVGAVLDVAHLAAQKMHPTLCVEMLGRRILYVHASDSDFLKENHLEIGKGKVDWRGLFLALKKHNFKGFIGIDVGGKNELKSDLDSIYINSKRYLETLLKEL